MNDIEKLEERIAQLTELVKTGTETIESLKETLKTVEEERDRLVDQRREQEPKFERAKGKEQYYFVNIAYRGFVVTSDTEMGYPLDEASYNSNNYYHTEQRAQKVVDKINFLMKLERLRDIYCPDYVPDWDNDNEYKFSIYYDTHKEKYTIQPYTIMKYETSVYFPTSEIAQKVCDILNAELEEKV